MISQQESPNSDNGQGEGGEDKVIAVYTQQLAIYTRHLRNATWSLAVVTILLAGIGAVTTALTCNAFDEQRKQDSAQLRRTDSALGTSYLSILKQDTVAQRQLRAYV